MEDASLTTKGVVKLSSAVDSTSESLAATPKAVKAANDNANSRVPSNRKVNGKALTADITLTPKDIGTLNSVTMSFSGGAGWFKLATVTMPQASSIVYIALIGGAGYNVGSPHQAGISELVLRAGNGNPKGIMRGWTIKGKPASGRAVLSQEQDGIKSHTHSASASSTDLGTKTTSSFDYGTKSTNNTGAHTHSISGTANSAGAHQHKSSGAFGGTNTSIFPNGYTAISNLSAGIMSTTSGSGQTRNAGKTSSDGAHTHSLSGTAASAGAHAHTVGIGAHTHSVAIGSHGHTITVNAAGNAENTVKNIAFNYIVRLA